MASEAPVADQKFDEPIEDVKGVDEVKDFDGGKDEVEKVKVEDSTILETNAAEPQENLEEKQSDALDVEVNKEESKEERLDTEPSIESQQKETNTATDISDSPEPSIAAHTPEPEEKLDEKQGDILDTEVNKEEPKDERPDVEPSLESEQKELTVSDQSDASEPSMEAHTAEPEEKLEEKQGDIFGTEESKEEPKDERQDVEPSVQPEQLETSTATDVSNTPEPSAEPAEVEATVMQEVESEVEKEPAVSETVTGEVEGAGEVPEVKEATVDATIGNNADDATDTHQVEKTITDAIQVSPEPSEEAPSSKDIKELVIEDENNKVHQNEEPESSVAADPTEVSETKEVGEAVVSEVPAEEIPNDNILPSSGDKDSKKDEKVSAIGDVQTTDTVPVTEAEAIEVSDDSPVTKTEDNVGSNVKIAQEEKENPVEVEYTTVPEATETVSIAEVAVVPQEVNFSGADEMVTDENNGNLEGEGAPLVETSRDVDVVGALSKVEESAKELDADGSVSETAEKPAEAKETLLDKFVNEGSEEKKKQETENVEKEDFAETEKADGDTNTDKEVPKQEIPTKTSQRHSNSILSKMKQSLVKVKKAITGKSPNSKTISSEVKDDAKEK